MTMKIKDLKLVDGIGDYADNTTCVMGAAVLYDRLSRGEPIGEATDDLDCVCPVLRALVIQRNDVFDDDGERTRWGMALVPRLIDTRGDIETTRERAWMAACAAQSIAAAAKRDICDLNADYAAEFCAELDEWIDCEDRVLYCGHQVALYTTLAAISADRWEWIDALVDEFALPECPVRASQVLMCNFA
jgi:hypothetical protein